MTSTPPQGVNGAVGEGGGGEVRILSDSSGVNSVEGTPHSGSVASFEEKVCLCVCMRVCLHYMCMCVCALNSLK